MPSFYKPEKQLHKTARKTKLLTMMFRTAEMTNGLQVTFFCNLPVYKFGKAKMRETVPFITRMVEASSWC